MGVERIVWDEGMLLTPQHFQQQDRFVQAELRRRSAMLLPRHWGIATLQIDPEALRTGEVRIDAAAGMFPNGFVFDAPRPDPLPAPRRFADLFDPKAGELAVHLAMPSLRSGGVAISDDGIDANRPT